MDNHCGVVEFVLSGRKLHSEDAETPPFDKTCPGVDSEYLVDVACDLEVGGGIGEIDKLHSLVGRLLKAAGWECKLPRRPQLHDRNEAH